MILSALIISTMIGLVALAGATLVVGWHWKMLWATIGIIYFITFLLCIGCSRSDGYD